MKMWSLVNTGSSAAYDARRMFSNAGYSEVPITKEEGINESTYRTLVLYVDFDAKTFSMTKYRPATATDAIQSYSATTPMYWLSARQAAAYDDMAIKAFQAENFSEAWRARADSLREKLKFTQQLLGVTAFCTSAALAATLLLC